MIEDPAGEVRRTVAPPSSVIRAVVMNIDRTVVAIVDEKDPSALRSLVGQALVATLIGSGYSASGSTQGTAMVAALAGRAEMVLSPLVARVAQVSPTSDGQVKGFWLEMELEVVLHLDDHFGEAIARLVAVGYGFRRGLRRGWSRRPHQPDGRTRPCPSDRVLHISRELIS